MPSFNRISIVGHSGKDATVKKVGEHDIAEFSVAVSQYQGKGKESTTGWYNVKAWGRLASWAAKVKKGGLVMVHGRLELREYTDANGAKRLAVDLNADEVLLMDKKDDKGDASDIPF